MDHRSFAMAAAAGAVALASVPASAQAPRTITFKETNKGSTFRFVDNPPRIKNPRRPRPSIGDQLVFTQRLVSDSGAGRGVLRATCTITGVAKSGATAALCYGVFALKEGQLVAIVSTNNLDAKTTTGTIVGGTRAYAGARGTFSSATTKTGADDTITLLG